MERINLEKNIGQIFQDRYVVPLYQRNYAWGAEEIQQLLQDVFESFQKHPTGNYFIGSLIVLKRRNGDFEVIDGQQRLTTLSLIAKILDGDNLKSQKLFFDSRPEVESFLSHFYQSETISDTTNNHLISHFVEAVEIINTTNLDSQSETKHLLNEMSDKDRSDFKKYFFENVILVRVEIPNDTDVAHYFEVMNNRGEQLEKHEILKARILDNLNADEKTTSTFSKIWDACSQMNIPLQSLFHSNERTLFFGDDYNEYRFDIDNYSQEANNKDSYYEKQENIDAIISNNFELNNSKSGLKEVIPISESIIDFPNFLMHVLSLYLQHEDIPLNGDELLNVFKEYETEIEPMEFIDHLFFYRVVFDRFIIKSVEEEDSEDQYKWSLLKPERYFYEKKEQNRLNYRNSFSNQERIIKGLSMLQVTFRTKKYKNWLLQVLSWFDAGDDIEISEKEFRSRLDKLILETFNGDNQYDSIFREKPFAQGTSTPHFLFNFIDYLMWLDGGEKHNFEFKYRNSIEHHLSQSARNNTNRDYIDNLGNLCLVSKGGNSKMNNESPVGKAKVGHKYYKEHLPPKQKRMYDLTNEKNEWGVDEIQEHYNELVKLLERREEILDK